MIEQLTVDLFGGLKSSVLQYSGSRFVSNFFSAHRPRICRTMGKKDKKKKGLGKAKTEAKAAKKNEKASRKARAAAGDEDVDAILAEILAKEAEALNVAQVNDCAPPSPRASFTMVASPLRDSDLILFGGERYTGDRAVFHNDLYVFNTERRTWTRFDSPNRPPPRSSHTVALHKNYMYLFGGEFSNPSLSQYRHYRDLWRLDLTDMSWERIEIRGGPSARSGCRMAVAAGRLFVFGGFVETGFDVIRYLNDLYYVDLTADDLKWTKKETEFDDVTPTPRSGFQWVALDDEIVLYGGYSRELVPKARAVSHKGKKKGGRAVEEAMVSRGIVLTDMFKLCAKTLRWSKLRKTGYAPSARAGFSMVLHKRTAVLFGGVEDDETEDDLDSIFYADLFGLNIDRRKWFPMTLRKKGSKKARRRRVKAESGAGLSSAGPSSAGPSRGEEDDIVMDDKNDDFDDEDVDGKIDDEEDDDEELDTEKLEAALKEQKEEENVPCGRFNAVCTVQKNVLYIAGGCIEKQEQEITLDDMWSVNLNKLDEFALVKELSEECSQWVASDSEGEEDEEDDGAMIDEKDDAAMEATDSDDEVDERIRMRSKRERLRSRIQSGNDSNLVPLVNESLKEFFDRTKNYWMAEVNEALSISGKLLRRTSFEWAYKRYWEIKPTLKELEELEAEIAREAVLEQQFAQAQIEKRRVRTRR